MKTAILKFPAAPSIEPPESVDDLQQAYAVLTQNEQAYLNIQRIRHRLVAARATATVITELITGLRDLDVDFVSVGLTKRIMGGPARLLDALPREIGHNVLLIHEETLEMLARAEDKPSCRINPDRRFLPQLFGSASDRIASSAICPMTVRSQFIGSVNLGSRSPHRFPPDVSPIYLEDLATTAALCLDNAIAHEANENLASSDPLTGIHNRRYFYEHADRMFAQAKRTGQPLACLYIDLDQFKQINDRHGHHAGDTALQRIAAALDRRVRRSDVFCRLGGDEFGLILPDTDQDKAGRVAEELGWVIEQTPLDDLVDDIRISASIGLSLMVEGDRSAYEMVQRADADMYRKKPPVD